MKIVYFTVKAAFFDFQDTSVELIHDNLDRLIMDGLEAESCQIVPVQEKKVEFPDVDFSNIIEDWQIEEWQERAHEEMNKL